MALKDAFTILIAVALSATAYAFALSGGDMTYLMIAQGAVIGIFLLAVMVGKRLARTNLQNLFLWLLFVITLLSNLGVNASNYSTEDLGAIAIRATGLCMLIFVLQWSATVLNPERILLIMGVVLTPLILYSTIISLESIGAERAAPFEIHPNWWGELLFCFSACALAMPNRAVRWAMLAVALILFYLAQSRGALLASLVTACLYLASTIKSNSVRPKHYLLGSAATACAAIALLWKFGLTTILDFLTDDVMRLHDTYRGIDSDFVGRAEGWTQAWEIFLANPIFGQGLDTMAEVHNGVLRLAAEGGVIMLFVILGITLSGMVQTRRTGNHLGFAIIVGYIVYVLFSPRFLNTNLASIAFFMSIFPWRTVRPIGQGISRNGTSDDVNLTQILHRKK